MQTITTTQRADGFWMAYIGDIAIITDCFTTEAMALLEGQRIMAERERMNRAITVPADLQAKFDAQQAERAAERAERQASLKAYKAMTPEQRRAYRAEKLQG